MHQDLLKIAGIVGIPRLKRASSILLSMPLHCFVQRIVFSLFWAALVYGADAKQPADLMVTHAYVVTMNGSKEIFENGVVVVKDGHIVALGPSSIAARYRAAKTIDAAGDIVMPGMINTHTHASMTVFRGLGDDVPDRLQRFIFPLEHKLVDRELVYWGGLYGMVEMIQGGVTTIADMYYFEDEVARAAQKIGMRGILGETVLNAPEPDAKEPYGGIAYAEKFIQDFRGDPLIKPCVRAARAVYSGWRTFTDHSKEGRCTGCAHIDACSGDA